MNSLIAKPVKIGNYWIVTDGDKKVGNVLATESGYDVKVNGQSKHFANTKTIQSTEHITFQQLEKPTKKDLPFAIFPTPAKVYNSFLDVRRKLHLFTKTKQSKCFHAAGWFAFSTGVILCPKYIFVERYPYQGPFKTKDEAAAALNILSE